MPRLGLDIIVSKRPSVQSHVDSSLFPGIQIYARKSLKFLCRPFDSRMSVVTDVDLTNIGAGKLAGVANLKGNIELGFGARLQADRLHFNVAVAESRVREAEAERKQWIHVISFIAPVAYKDAFRVDNLPGQWILVVIIREAGIVRELLFPCPKRSRMSAVPPSSPAYQP